jgi:hypothetical protein
MQVVCFKEKIRVLLNADPGGERRIWAMFMLCHAQKLSTELLAWEQ